MNNSTVTILELTTQENQEKEPDDAGLFLFTMMIRAKELIAFVGMFGNAFMLLLYFKYKELRALAPICSLILLAAADFIQLAGVMLIKLSLALHPTVWVMNGITCALFYLPAFFGSQLSLIFPVYVALERFAAVWYPLRFRVSNIKTNAMAAGALTFAVATVYMGATILMMKVRFLDPLAPDGCFMPALIPDWFWLVAIVFKNIELVVCGVLYVLIFVKARRQLHATVPATDLQAQLLMKRERRLTQATLLVLLVYLLSVTVPSSLQYIVPLFVGKVTPITQRILVQTMGLGSAINGSVNVVIYVARCDEMQFHAYKFFGKVEKNKSFNQNGGNTPASNPK